MKDLSPSYPVGVTAVSAPDFDCPWPMDPPGNSNLFWDKGKQTGVWHTSLNVGW